MFGFLKKLFGGNSVDYKELVKNGAQIIDVRTPAEFNGGHVKGAKNIPLQSLNQNLGKINKKQTGNHMLCKWRKKCCCKKHFTKQWIYRSL
ncbi:MAG: rhodanese-like domain-containing protein [Aliarcobacter cryaerophilus]|nr:rhodanese-like domain-containing protein [Aliarcobacter cryaerophilus]